MKKYLHYKGRDSWSRPVYEDENGIIWKDIDPRADRNAVLCTSVDNSFDGEPDTHMKEDMEIIFVPERDTWDLD